MTRSGTALLLTALLILAGCGISDGGSTSSPGAGDTSDTGPDEPVTMTPEPGSDVHDVDDRPERVHPRPGMVDLRQVPWEKARPTPGGKALRIVYWSGVEPCNVLDHVDVDYGGSEITVTLFEGHDPEADDVVCIEIALRKVVRVPLAEPVEGRDLVDGASPS